MTKKVEVPFTEAQVARLNEYQKNGMFHPFTCGNHDCRAKHPESVLVAKPDGWHCPHCDYRQNWAHGFMTEKQMTPEEFFEEQGWPHPDHFRPKPE